MGCRFLVHVSLNSSHKPLGLPLKSPTEMKSVADTDRANENKNSLEIRDERGEGERRDEERTRKFCVLDVKEENLIAKFNTSLSLSLS